ncbi:MAG: hypothetical protein GHCLOJNM_02412 [bacterium]|nr:hypothetical protein [bacterium]
MVERITSDAIHQYTAELAARGLLTEDLAGEIRRLTDESERLSNWTDASRHLPSAGYHRIRASGPVSKVLRTLAFLLERLSEASGELAERGSKVSRVHLEDTHSGCSDYSGRIVVQVIEPEGAEVVLFEGTFVWDCAAQGMPQPKAAQELGYRCMVSFPEVIELAMA